MRVQAALLSLSRTSLYYRPALPSAEEVALKHRIDEIYTAYPFYGSRRIREQLVQHDGLTISRKTVQRHMQEMGIAGIAPGPNLSQRRKEHVVYPYLLRGVTSSHPNQVWGIDTVNSQLAKMAVERLHARTNPGFCFKVHASIVALALTNAN